MTCVPPPLGENPDPETVGIALFAGMRATRPVHAIKLFSAAAHKSMRQTEIRKTIFRVPILRKWRIRLFDSGPVRRGLLDEILST
jgi:hypothetical protein